jgi:hypothetical protein
MLRQKDQLITQIHTLIGYNAGEPVTGVVFGESLDGDNYLRLDQGVDSTEISPKQTLRSGFD